MRNNIMMQLVFVKMVIKTSLLTMAKRIAMTSVAKMALEGDLCSLDLDQNLENDILFSLPKPCMNFVADRVDKNAVLNIINAPIM
jgi:hypothetical protein